MYKGEELMVYKVLIYICYDEDEYKNYFHAYLNESKETIGKYEVEEIDDLFKEIKNQMEVYSEQDKIDLYLARESVAKEWEFNNQLDELGISLSEKTEWTDEQAYSAIMHLVGEDKSVYLDGFETKIGCEEESIIDVECSYCAKKMIRYQTSDYSKSEHRTEKTPSLAELMKIIAEGGY